MKKIIPLLLISLLAACDSSDDNSGNSSTHPIYGNQTDTPSEQENTEPEKEKTISGVYRGNVPGAIGTKMLITETGKIHLYWPRSYIIAQLSSDLSEQDHYGSLIRYTYLDFQNDEYSFTNCDSTCTEITEIGTVYIGLATANNVISYELHLGKHRERVLEKAVNKVMELLYKEVF